MPALEGILPAGRGPAKESRHQPLTQGLCAMAHSVVRYALPTAETVTVTYHCRKAHAASIGLGMASCNGYSNSHVPLEAARWRAWCENGLARRRREAYAQHAAPTERGKAGSSAALKPCKTPLRTNCNDPPGELSPAKAGCAPYPSDSLPRSLPYSIPS